MSYKSVLIGSPKSKDDVSLVKRAFSEGALINRIDEWFHTSSSGKTDFEFWSECPVKRPRWTARSGYRIDRTCEWWIKHTLAEKITCMP